MRVIRTITIHCSDSDNPKHDNIATIKKWHTDPKPLGNGWKDIGYHYFISKDGNIEKGRPLEIIPASAKNHNDDTIAICLSGQKDFQFIQFKIAALLIDQLAKRFNIKLNHVYPHNFFNPNKTCPNFDIKEIMDILKTN